VTLDLAAQAAIVIHLTLGGLAVDWLRRQPARERRLDLFDWVGLGVLWLLGPLAFIGVAYRNAVVRGRVRP
jgi:hypothetical protein